MNDTPQTPAQRHAERHRKKRLERSAARLGAVQILYQMEMTGISVSKALSEFEDYHQGMEIDGMKMCEAELPYMRKLIAGVVGEQRELDKRIHAAIDGGWPLGRIDATLRALFRAASYELKVLNVPTRVVLNEYIDLARAFYDQGQEPKLVNAVLDRLARELRAEA